MGGGASLLYAGDELVRSRAGSFPYLCLNLWDEYSLSTTDRSAAVSQSLIPSRSPRGGLGTHPTHQLLAFVTDYVQRESVERIIIGYPRQMNNEESASMKYIRPFVEKLRKALPSVPIEYQDERFTSTLAQRAIREAGIGKKRREQDKGLVDEVSAVIILQSYLESRDGLGAIRLPFK